MSIDAEETSYSTDDDRWRFVRSDDVEFTTDFDKWCENDDIDSAIDVLFVDTSHRYEHTAAEIDARFPHLAAGGPVLFHDTNTRRLYRREDGTVGLSPFHDRG